MKEGALSTNPSGKTVFPQGSAGFVNSERTSYVKVRQGEKTGFP